MTETKANFFAFFLYVSADLQKRTKPRALWPLDLKSLKI